jgi:hypothetical protein
MGGLHLRARYKPGHSKIMKIQTKKAKRGLSVDQILMLEITKFTYKPPEGAPEECFAHFTHPSFKEPALMALTATVENDSPMARFISTVRAKALTPDEIEHGYDPSELVGRKVPGFVTIKKGSGGKLVPVVGPVFDLKTLKENVAALEE